MSKFFQALKKVGRTVKNAGCKIGLHSGIWEYQNPEECSQIRICERCGEKSKRVNHNWGEWDYLYEKDCRQLSLCLRCAEEQERTEHQWGPWRYESKASCLQLRICDRCLETEYGSKKHIFDHLEYMDQNSCLQVEKCSRCGEVGSNKHLNHDWGEWEFSTTHETPTPMRICRRCGEIEKKEDN